MNILNSINKNLIKLDKIFTLLDDQSPEQKKIIERYTNLKEKISPWLVDKNNDYVYWLDIFSKSVLFFVPLFIFIKLPEKPIFFIKFDK